MDTGTAYGRAQPGYRSELTHVGAGTPMGELLRRYWHPVALGSDATAAPRLVRALGEDLILFRDGEGRPGLLYPRCAHRGTTLYYGKVEARGIRCCYHGWLYDVEGHCLEQPCEDAGGPRRDRIRQPWYPLEERYGLVFAYLGPPQKKPLLPRYDCLEELSTGEFIEPDDSSIGSGGPQIVPCNWFQHWENVVDPFHVPVLHGSFSGAQFTAQMGIVPKVEFSTTGRGVKVESWRDLGDGKVHHRITETVCPTLRVVPNPRVERYQRVESIGWVLPIDDTRYRIYTAGRVTERGALQKVRSRQGGKRWEELSAAEHREFPGDYEAQTGQGAITLHSEEHLATSDKGIALLRRFMEAQLKVVAEGGDPAGVNDAYVRFDAGNNLIEK
ncbi:MAG TPA: aromatic ring-hydroxylating dioxygenase subunit alpha [Burkholderiales bacterium]|nr:aromatic ring-hydroxylating dioxygenase subunit alpha [Burkholderiales bacterium]